jgi:hypothetical protein
MMTDIILLLVFFGQVATVAYLSRVSVKVDMLLDRKQHYRL